MRGGLAIGLCATSKVLTTVMAVLSGLGVFIAIIVLAAAGTISVAAAIGIFIIGVPVIEGVAYLLTMGVAMAMLYTAKLLDGDAVADWVDRQEMLGY